MSQTGQGSGSQKTREGHTPGGFDMYYYILLFLFTFFLGAEKELYFQLLILWH